MFDLRAHTIFMTLAGSHAHGTARPDSDVDVRGVCVSPLDQRLSLFSTFEQHEGPLEGDLLDLVRDALQSHPTARHGLEVKAECVVFDVAKFLRLCAAANPNTLEVLFADPRDWLHADPAWRRISAERHRFLTQQVQQTFLNYAMGQLKRIKTHRAWLLNPPKQRPLRADYGLPEGPTLGRDDLVRLEKRVQERIASYGLAAVEMPREARLALQERMLAFWRDAMAAGDDDLDQRMRAVATGALSLPADVVATLSAEKRYLGAMKHWRSYQIWKSQRNKDRAKLEKDHGYDTKHAMHMVRLMHMGLEALRRGDLEVRRPDAAELNAIRNGALSFDELLARASELRAEMTAAAASTVLPTTVDPEFVDALAYEVMVAVR